MNGMNTYKFRAECMSDVCALLPLIAGPNLIESVNITTNKDYPDVQAEITTVYPIGAIMEAMRQVPDGHVMRQTLQPIETYTGERDYTIQ